MTILDDLAYHQRSGYPGLDQGIVMMDHHDGHDDGSCRDCHDKQDDAHDDEGDLHPEDSRYHDHGCHE